MNTLYLQNLHRKKKLRIRESIKGNYLDDPKISEEFIYWFFANRFGYTSEQVDNLPYDRMVYFIELEQELKKQEKINMNK